MNKVGKYSLCFMLLIFFAIFALVGGTSYFENYRNQKIAQTGTPVTADVVEAWTDLSINGVEYYYIEFTYNDLETGAKHTGKTNTVYSYDEAYILCFETKKIEIKYNENYEAVAADYRFSSDFGMKATFFYVGVIAIGIVVISLVCITIQVKKESSVKRNGHSAVATFVQKTCNTYVNGRPRYRIVYKFNAGEEGGAERTVKSRELFVLEDAVYYEANKQFDIKYSGKIVVITEKPYSKPAGTQNSAPEVGSINNEDGVCEEHNNCDFNANDLSNKIPVTSYKDFGDDYIERETALDKNILCEHCAAHLSPKDKHCPNCGAKVHKK